jgi:hypothetical protein
MNSLFDESLHLHCSVNTDRYVCIRWVQWIQCHGVTFAYLDERNLSCCVVISAAVIFVREGVFAIVADYGDDSRK